MRHIILDEAELARRSELMPPADGGRADAQRERLSWFCRGEYSTQPRRRCPGKCGRYVMSGLCHECDAMCDAKLVTR